MTLDAVYSLELKRYFKKTIYFLSKCLKISYKPKDSIFSHQICIPVSVDSAAQNSAARMQVAKISLFVDEEHMCYV